MIEVEANSNADRTEALPTTKTPEPTPARSLTIPSKRLAGSPACLNCGTTLAGPFCHYCGQPDKNLLRFFPVLLRELLADFLDFDSRFARTMKPLLFHPGKLTRDYLDGRRFRYTPPLRLYIFASMAFFLIAAMLANSALVNNSDGQAFQFGNDKASIKVDKGLEEAVKAGEMTAEEAAAEDDTININGEPWDRETNPFIVPGAPDFINDWINDEIEDSPRKGREIEANPNIIVDKVMDVLPIAVFIMLPLVALLLKFWYLFSGHYYVEHLIHALHNHAFLFVVFILMLMADAVAALVEPDTENLLKQIAGWIDVVAVIWIPLYLLISLKRVYQQGWTLTLAKFSMVGMSYTLLLLVVTGAAALAGFVLL
jgi:hypothetical protein